MSTTQQPLSQEELSQRIAEIQQQSDIESISQITDSLLQDLPERSPMPGRRVMVSKEIEFDAGHRVPNHKSKCRNPHGHRYRVRVSCSGYIVTTPGSSDEGMLVDFSDLKSLMTIKIHDVLDHGFIVYEGDLALLDCFDGDHEWNIIEVPFIPTAENIAIWCWQQLEHEIEEQYELNELRLQKVEVWETPTSCATYAGG